MLNKTNFATTVFSFFVLASCQAQVNEVLINPEGASVIERIQAPEGFERIETTAGSFGYYLQHLTLKPHLSPVMHYNGSTKHNKVHAAVIDIPVGNKDLQQCADAIMRLRSEYLYSIKTYDKIHFNFTNGFRADYSKWRSGMRIKVAGNTCSWYNTTNESKSYAAFEKYLEAVFMYAGTLSLSKELVAKPLKDMQIGDVFIQGGSPGHAIIILDMAINQHSGEKLFLLAQSYMPAQDIHILINPEDKQLSPWYSLRFGSNLLTPEWQFNHNNLKQFPKD